MSTPKPTEAASIAIASFAVLGELLVVLSNKGTLTRKESAGLLEEAKKKARGDNPTNAGAAHLIEELRDAIERLG